LFDECGEEWGIEVFDFLDNVCESEFFGGCWWVWGSGVAWCDGEQGCANEGEGTE
jgi:hypothetical protein